jgi:hypothetical protein
MAQERETRERAAISLVAAENSPRRRLIGGAN